MLIHLSFYDSHPTFMVLICFIMLNFHYNFYSYCMDACIPLRDFHLFLATVRMQNHLSFSSSPTPINSCFSREMRMLIVIFNQIMMKCRRLRAIHVCFNLMTFRFSPDFLQKWRERPSCKTKVDLVIVECRCQRMFQTF